MYQSDNLPLPLPIRDPTDFFVSGKCGKALNHSFLPVLSDLRDDFFKNSFSLNKDLLLIRVGLNKRNPH